MDDRPRDSTPQSAGSLQSGAAIRQQVSQALERAEAETRTPRSQSGQSPPAEVSLETEWQRLFSLLNVLPAIIYLKAPDYTIRFANRYFRDLFGDPDSEACYRVVHGRARPCERCATASVLEVGRPLEREWTYPDGKSYQLYDYPFVDVDGTEMVLQLGIDITRRKQVEAELERTNRELLALSQLEHRERLFAEGLAQASLALNSSLDGAEVLDRILEQTVRVIPCNAATVLLLEDRRIQLVRQRGFMPIFEGLEQLRAGVPLDAVPLLGAACSEGRPALIRDVAQDHEAEMIFGLEWVRSLVMVPMVQEESVMGLIALFSDEPDFFPQESIRRLEAFATHAVLAIQNTRLFQRMKESREQLQSLSRRLVDVQENERRYVARELHDEAGQALTSLMIQLKLVQREADDPEAVLERTADLVQAVEGVMENLHRLAMDLRPASLDHLGLVATVRQYCEMVSGQAGLDVAFEAIGLDGRLKGHVEIALYRIVQEALNNVVRHARARHAGVVLERDGDRVVAIIEDDGVGFAPGAVQEMKHLGLLGMQERAEALGGTLTIESSPLGGTAVFAEVPYVD